MAVPAALQTATLSAAVTGLVQFNHAPYTEPDPDLLASAQNLAAALIQTGLVGNPILLVNFGLIPVPVKN